MIDAMRSIRIVAVGAALLCVVACGVEFSDDVPSAGNRTDTTTTTVDDRVPDDRVDEDGIDEDGVDQDRVDEDGVDEDRPPTTSLPVTTTTVAVAVLDIIDGDTIRVEGGRSVRLIGIDTPERGECGYTEATFVLASLIRDRPVVLVPGARTDTDRYGRLLRYVEVDGVDVNLEMIRSGRAVARYDSRDGYGRHPREDLYVSTDAATPSTNNCTPPPGGARNGDAVTGSDATGTDPRFRTCKEAKAAGFGHYVRGVDPEYHWYRDADNDGIACE